MFRRFRAGTMVGDLVAKASNGALAIGAGHLFIVVMRDGFAVNVLNQVKLLPEVCHIFCATANPLEVLIAESEQGRGILGVIDGGPRLAARPMPMSRPSGGPLRDLGYKL